MLQFGRQVEQTDVIQLYYIDGGLEQSPVLGNFRKTFKKITALTSFGSHFECFQVHWKEQSC